MPPRERDGMNIGVLIVDDQEDMRTLLRLLIRAADGGLFVSGEAADGEEALGVVEDADPRVVLLDWMMPRMNGLEAAEQILRRRPGQRIVLYSAAMDEDLRRKADVVGVSACLEKSELLELPERLYEIAGVA